MEVHGKIVIVTGASSGIGRAIAKLLTDKGAKVALVSRSRDKLESLSKQLPGSLAVPADMTKYAEIRSMVEQVKNHYGRIDILINSAGQGYDAPVEKTNIDMFHRIFELDVVGPLIAMQHVIPIMRNQGGGMIVNISSGTALMHLANMAAYSSLKRALADISLTAREELKADNIAVSVAYPYSTLTDFEKNTIKEPDVDYGEEGAPFPADTAEYVAQKVLEGIEKEDAEIFPHEWMGKLAGSRRIQAEISDAPIIP